MKDTLIAIGAAHALYLIVLILTKKNKRGSDYILTAYFATFFVTLCTAFGAFAYAMEDLLVFHLNSSLVLAPLFFLYITALTQPDTPPFSRRLAHFIPYLLTTCYWLSLFVTQPEPEVTALFALDEVAQMPLLFTLALLVEALAIPAYVIWAWWHLKKHQQTVIHTFSYTEGVDLKWARVLTYGTGAFWLGIVVSEALSTGVKFNTDEEALRTGYALATFFLFYLGYFGLRQGHLSTPSLTQTAPQFPSSEAPLAAAKYSKSRLKAEDGEALAETVRTYLKTEKPYLQSRLSIQDLAEALSLSSHALSQVINEHLNSSFYDLINQHRVDEFKARLTASQYKNYTLIAIALDSGFNSKSSFNRIFKKMEGCTPTQYLNSIQEAEVKRS